MYMNRLSTILARAHNAHRVAGKDQQDDNDYGEEHHSIFHMPHFRVFSHGEEFVALSEAGEKALMVGD
jgi:hypothetical protein